MYVSAANPVGTRPEPPAAMVNVFGGLNRVAARLDLGDGSDIGGWKD
jgi:hypothetical protein